MEEETKEIKRNKKKIKKGRVNCVKWYYTTAHPHPNG